MKIKSLPSLILTMVFVLTSLLTKAQLPYFQSFKETTANNIQFGGSPTAVLTAAAGIDAPGAGYLRLTNGLLNQKGYVYGTDNFSTNQGLSISFEYFTYGGSGADGICFFLFDATASPFNIGGFGGSLGYAQFNLTDPVSPGVSKGYIGVALDEFGNFPNPREGRQGGIVGPGLYGISSKSVVLRGKGNGAAQTPDNYRYLTSVSASDKGVDLVDDGAATMRSPDSTQLGYRKAYIDLQPNVNGGYNVSVRIKVGGTPTKTTTVIDNYYYPDAAPALVRYGIASSTGDLTNFHEIRNVRIDIYQRPFTSPIALNDQITECAGKTSTINVAGNDASTNPGGNIDLNSIDLDPFVSGEQKSFLVAGKGVFTANNDGTVTFTPLNSSVTGTVTVKYTISDNFGYKSAPATITIAEPVTTIMANAGIDQLINIGSPTGTTTITGNSPANSTSKWVQKSGPNGAVINSPNAASTAITGPNGTYVFTYTLTAQSQCPVTDDIQVIINAIPVAVNDIVNGNVNSPTQINVINNDTDRDGNATIDNTSVVIKTQPTNGTLTVNPTTGVVTYTPNAGYSGPDSFTYTVKDNRGAESNPATVTIAVPAPPKIGLAKSLLSIDNQADGSFNVKFQFNIKNYGNVVLQDISLKDDLAAAFPGTTIRVITLASTGANNLNTNNAFNGTSITELLTGNNQLPSGATAQVELLVNILIPGNNFSFTNTSFVEGASVTDGTKTTDQSTDGVTPDPITPGDVTPAVPTPVKFIVDKIFIPGGFSPNGDGTNDKFVIPNAGLTPVDLEVYNRWGNIVYKSADYLNTWNGTSNKGLLIGQDLPVGTYYYIVVYNGKKYNGYLTLNR
ncbi:gliding motility-associated C-terminal domain-containing protein [Pedobacter sp. SD-b]|uniref:Gliding motility-associated C-terminal domain-containing protein n=1 Tax=Pedobacter segetis TaxID=2793069 RepID=A0ABS1BL99_9SPHI|nr:gliding motility-associated C-terminal domain-containing protein [Pedobacter segetis]MBK0383670.1 gliding motility-associated C-terminal domain-containing protein [Pedobacter segetis]